MTVTITDPAFDETLQALKNLAKKQIKVGLPSTSGGNLSFILGIQEHGSPVNRIPPRPVVKPALSSPQVRTAMSEALLTAISAAWEGDSSAANSALESAGQAGADGIRAFIDSGISPPNAPITVSGGWMRNRVSGKPVHIPGKGASHPLVDSGALYAAFSYEIEE